MKSEYMVTIPVKTDGYQTFSVTADSEESAIDIIGAGGGIFVDESFEVQNFMIDQATVEVC